MADSVRDIKSIFGMAMELHTPSERAAYLDQACHGDPLLRGEVESLLQAQPGAAGFFGGVIPNPVQTCDAPITELAGALIGPYKLLQQIGEGGMGTVFMAEQHEPVKRRVALKIIKPGMDTRQVIARFEAERQALSLMDHPNIAKVLDAGTTASGRPYFVMELVKGQPITQYCDEKHLTPRQRLELLLPVCQAIQHAHQKGIIHRDIKPTNILVAEYDQQPVPKVIDFGVAKATSQTLTEKTMFTGLGQIVGTLEYMSPEQAKVNQLDIDTRSDIYSLGVLMYELLTGSTPFDRKRLCSAAFDEMLRIIREEEPPKPSTRLSDSHDSLPSISAQRHTEPAKLTKLVRGELDWIVMKCLEKDRNRRYETANGFAADVQRYLNDEPVQVCPPSAGYRLRKFVRRNKGPVLAVSLLALALVGGVIGTTWGMLRATFAEAEAVREAGEKTVALAEKETALATAKANEIQAKAAQQDAQENLEDALAAVDQMLTRVADDRLMYVPQMEPIRRDLLLDALKFYQKFLEKQSDDPVILREISFAHRRVGRIHDQLGQYEEAERAYRIAIEMFDKLDSSVFAAPAFLRAMSACHIEFYWVLGFLGKIEGSRQAIRRAVELADKLDPKAPDNRVYILNARNNLANDLRSEQPEEAEKILKANLALAEDAFSLEGVHRGLGHVFEATQRWAQAEEAFRQALTSAEQMAKENSSANWVQGAVAFDQICLARVIARQRPQEAEEIQRRAVLILDKLVTDFPNSPPYKKNLADALIEDARLLKQLGQTADAEKAYRRAIGVYEKLATYVSTQLAHRVELGHMLSSAGKKQEAEVEFRQVVTLSEKLEADFAGKPEHRRELAHHHTLTAETLAEAGRHADADRLYDWALQHRVALVHEAPESKQSLEELAGLHTSLGHRHLWRTRRLKDADRSFQAAIKIYEKLALQFPEMPVYRARGAECRILLGVVAGRDGRTSQGEQILRQGLQLAEQVAKELPNDADLRHILGNGYRWLVELLRGAGSPQEVEKLLVQSLAILDKLVVEFPKSDLYLCGLGWTCHALANQHFKSGRTEEGRRLYQRAVEVSKQILANNAASANNVGWLNQSAWFLVSRADGSPPGARLAVELAKRAVAKEPQGYIVNTLGTAHYRAGDWNSAIETLKKAEEMTPQKYFGANAIIIAMSYWRLDNKDEARRWYDRAVEWMEKNSPKDEELRQFRAEAEELLELKEKK